MKMCIKNLFLLLALIAGLNLTLAGRATAQTFTTLHSFPASSSIQYVPGLILSGNTLYGTTFLGGSIDHGTVFKVNTNGNGSAVLLDFTSTNFANGRNPAGTLLLSGSTLYGTTFNGGSNGFGTVFSVDTDGSNYRVIWNLGAADGKFPNAGLTLSGSTLYGTAKAGGTNGGNAGYGTVFKVNTDGSSFTALKHFSSSDGVNPVSRLVLAGNRLYGTASCFPSTCNGGAVFALNTDGSGYTNLHLFLQSGGVTDDGAQPTAGLVFSGGTLYGTTQSGGHGGAGTVFSINSNGTGYAILHDFNTNGIFIYPIGELALAGDTLYGTTYYGGAAGVGTVYKLKTNGTSFAFLHDFSAPIDGQCPKAELIIADNVLYGTTTGGGSFGKGTVFSLSLASLSAPQLTIIRSEANVILTWPTNPAGFTLQCTTNLVSPATWTPVSPGPVVVNGQYTVTNPISGTQKFYRLCQ